MKMRYIHQNKHSQKTKKDAAHGRGYEPNTYKMCDLFPEGEDHYQIVESKLHLHGVVALQRFELHLPFLFHHVSPHMPHIA